tara:strand:- start:1375 stop:1677 length:303 start_codon:yes stop_codon:yes gene_type:complete
MSSDLLFSILPREGKEPIKHDELKVQKVLKESALRELSDKEQELHLEEREARQQQQSKFKKKPKEQETKKVEETSEPSTDNENDQNDKDNKGFKHLDIYV